MIAYDCRERFNPNACSLCLYYKGPKIGCSQDVCCCDEPQHPVRRHGKEVNYPEPLLRELEALRNLAKAKAKTEVEKDVSYPEPLLRMFAALRNSAETEAE